MVAYFIGFKEMDGGCQRFVIADDNSVVYIERRHQWWLLRELILVLQSVVCELHTLVDFGKPWTWGQRKEQGPQWSTC